MENQNQDQEQNSITEHQRLSSEFSRLAEACQGQEMTFDDLLGQLRHRGFTLMTLFLSLPFIIPVPLPMPGISLTFGLCIFFLGYRMFLKKDFWLPQKYLDHKIPSSFFVKIFNIGERVMKKLEVLIKPRGKIFHSHPYIRAINGGMIGICGLLLASPFPPGTNFPPAAAILLLSIGELEEDGLFIVLGQFVFLLNVIFFSLVPIIGYSAIKALMMKF